MEGRNLVILVGNLGQDPELRYTQSGMGVLSTRIAVTESYKTSNEWKEKTEWISIVLWGKLAEAMHKMLVKGSRVHVEGSLVNRSWEDKEGNKRYATEVNVTKIIVLSFPEKKEAALPNDRSEEPPLDNDDDIPF